jgi:replicative superfamily II helicase
VRARKLHRAGYTSIERLKEAKAADLAEILGPKIAGKVIAQIRADGGGEGEEREGGGRW